MFKPARQRALLLLPLSVTTLGAMAFVSPTAQAQIPTAPLINCPVAPEAIYVVRHGAESGLSVIDLNGFGQGTGNPFFAPAFSSLSEGTSMFPHNPNVALQGALLIPPLFPGTTARTGGSAGVFTLSRDTQLNDLLQPAQGVGRLGDMMLGHPLDTVYNNGTAPFGCAQGGGSVCTLTGIKEVGPSNGFPVANKTPVPLQIGSTVATGIPGVGNPISWAPHPNPPPLLTIPLCESPAILGQEPTSIASLKAGMADLLVPGDAFGDPSNGVAPTGTLGDSKTSFFVGPSPSLPSIGSCETFQLRQQVGHFLYAIDEDAGELVILNSNRMLVLDRIVLSDPTELAIDPNLNFLAVSNKSAGTVSVIDINPISPSFHQVIKTVVVGSNPMGIAWQPDDEDLLVCNAGDSTLSIISTSTFTVRKTVQVGDGHAFALAVTPRHTSYASKSDVYYAWILDRTGQVWVYESGPSGQNGWGYDDVVMKSNFKLKRARALQLDPLDPSDSVWIVHEQAVDITGNPTGGPGGAVTKLILRHAFTGPIRVPVGSVPNPRGKSLLIERSLGAGVLTGHPMDLAFDNMHNLGVFPNTATVFSSSAPVQTNGKHPMRGTLAFGTQDTHLPTNRAKYMFIPVRDQQAGTERIDVIDLVNGIRVDTNVFHAGVQSIPAPGARLVMDYFRQ